MASHLSLFVELLSNIVFASEEFFLMVVRYLRVRVKNKQELLNLCKSITRQ